MDVVDDEVAKPRKKPRQARSRETVACILEAAARVFEAEGYEATTKRVAEVAGVGIGSLYEYFPNKDALLYGLGERHIEEGEAALAGAFDGVGEDEVDGWVAALLDAMVRLHRDRPQVHELLAIIGPRCPELVERAMRLSGGLVVELTRRLTGAQPELEEPSEVAELVVETMGQLVHSRVVSAGSDAEAERRAKQLLTMCLAYVRESCSARGNADCGTMEGVPLSCSEPRNSVGTK